MTTEDSVSVAREWLQALRVEIWASNWETARTNMDGREYVREIATLRRKLIMEEFVRLKEVARLFIVTPANCDYGFNFGIGLHWIPPYPDINPVSIIFISGSHLPEGMNDQFDGAWEALSPLSHNAHNQKLLEFHGLELAREKGYYDY